MQPDQLPPARPVEPRIEANLQPNEGLSTQGPMSSWILKVGCRERQRQCWRPSLLPLPTRLLPFTTLSRWGRADTAAGQNIMVSQGKHSLQSHQGENCNGIIIVHHIKGLHVCIVSEAVLRNRQLQGSSIQVGPSIDEVLM